MSSRSRSQRKKGKPRKFNYTRKSAGLPPRWRKIAYGQNLCNKQYTPCGCHGMCGKECSCLLNGTCCEKYCGYVNFHLVMSLILLSIKEIEQQLHHILNFS